MRVRVEEEPLDHDVWGSVVDVEVGDEVEVLADLRAMLDPNKKYVVRRHYCGHDERKPCTVEVIG